MKTDRFAKIVLTGIFICLIILTFKGFDIVQTANASRKETINVNIERVAGHFIKAVPVKLVK